ncbi:uncharacterized protein N0V96_006596 [Colletotrichum fioriniae]|uniref:uncharacterized protein n=1 Tax=Colletotrichum fioriniae TaxID=710243 RepID=UPI0032DB115B|nr:hypothetical protein N0V96_006596 [Colletotrichum fioriniae]
MWLLKAATIAAAAAAAGLQLVPLQPHQQQRPLQQLHLLHPLRRRLPANLNIDNVDNYAAASTPTANDDIYIDIDSAANHHNNIFVRGTSSSAAAAAAANNNINNTASSVHYGSSTSLFSTPGTDNDKPSKNNDIDADRSSG